MEKFILKAKYSPTKDQERAATALYSGLKKGYKEQTLLGVTGS